MTDRDFPVAPRTDAPRKDAARYPVSGPARDGDHDTYGPVVNRGGMGMNSRTAITVNRPRDEVERLWRSAEYRPAYIDDADPAGTFKEAPGGDRGTEIHVDLEGGSKLGEVVQKLVGSEPLAKVKDDLRHFKQRVETGEVPRSDGSPEGERAERKLKQRPAQPLEDSELEKAGVR